MNAEQASKLAMRKPTLLAMREGRSRWEVRATVPNLAHAAVLAGANALFITAADLLLDLAKQETARALERRLRHYAQPALLCVDSCEVPGYVESA